MSNASRDRGKGSTSSGQGALGMGGQPTDDPRDLDGGSEGPANDDRTRQVGGASGAPGGGKPTDQLSTIGGGMASSDVDSAIESRP